MWNHFYPSKSYNQHTPGKTGPQSAIGFGPQFVERIPSVPRFWCISHYGSRSACLWHPRPNPKRATNESMNSMTKMTKNDKKCYDNWELNKLGTGELQLSSLFLLHIGYLHLPRIPGNPPGWHDTPCYLNLCTFATSQAIASWKVATFQIIYLPNCTFTYPRLYKTPTLSRWFSGNKKSFPGFTVGPYFAIVSEWWVDFFEIRILSQNRGYTIHGTGIFTYI